MQRGTLCLTVNVAWLSVARAVVKYSSWHSGTGPVADFV